MGDPAIKSINAMAFGPEGILFIGDSKHASVFAIEMKEGTSRSSEEAINLKGVDVKLAGLLGTDPENVSIKDMAVHPISHSVYFAVHTDGDKPALFKTQGETFTHVPLSDVYYSKIALANAVEEGAKDRRGRALRKWAISDLSFFNGEVMISGLSNEEFASTFRSIPFPFKTDQMHASLEIYHAAHAQYETHSPIKTFLPYELDGEAHLIASYTCTPLVLFPLSEMTSGKHTKGKTVAELGNRNTPLDIISYENKGKPYILMANSTRAVMKISADDLANFKDFLKDPVEENGGTAGINFYAMPYVNVQQLDDYSDQFVLMLQRKSDGDLTLMTVDKRRL